MPKAASISICYELTENDQLKEGRPELFLSVLPVRAFGGTERFSTDPIKKSVWARWVLRACVVLLGGLIAFFRLPWKAQRTLWAEDGGIFLNDALNGVGWSGIFQPYEGYLHVVPRLAANTVVSFFPVDAYALVMSLSSCVLIGIVALMVFHFSKDLCENTLIRFCWASATILVAPGPLETLGNYANIHWYLLWLTPWLLLRAAKSRVGGGLLFITALLVSLTEILVLIFIPIFFYRFSRKGLWPARLGLASGLACQALTTLLYPRSPSSGYPVNPSSVFEGWVLNSSSSVIYGDSESIAHHIQTFGFISIIVSALPFTVVFALCVWKGELRHRVSAIVMVLASAITWTATQIANPQPFFDYARFADADWGGFFLSRYSTVPSIFLIALIPLAAAIWMPVARLLSGALIGVFVILQVVFFFPTTVSRSDGPVWSDGVAVGRQACAADRSLNLVPVPIAPRGWFADKVNVPCRKLIS